MPSNRNKVYNAADEKHADAQHGDKSGKNEVAAYVNAALAKKKVGMDPADGWGILDPRSKIMQHWEFLGAICLIYTAFVTPFEVAFLKGGGVDALFIINWVVNGYFIFDMLLQFRLAYWNEDRRTWVISPGQLAFKYLTGWFVVDFVSVIPFDTFSMVLNDPELQNLAIFRMVKLFRLLKLMRMVKGMKMIDKIESKMSINHGYMEIAKFCIMMVLLAHWMACIFRLIPEQTGATKSWMTEYMEMDKALISSQFVTAIYWAVMTMTTIGYGDVTPQSDGERIWGIVCMLVGASFYAYVVGAVCGIVASLNEAQSKFHSTMDNLNNFMREHAIEHSLRQRLREYFLRCRELHRQEGYDQLVDQMSPSLRGEVTVLLNKDWISTVWFFNTHDEHETNLFITSISMKLRPAVFAPRELVIERGSRGVKMYLVQKGIAARTGGILHNRGKYFGEDMVLSKCVRHYDVRALTYLHVNTLDIADLQHILAETEFPHTKRKIRKAVIVMSFFRDFIGHAPEIKASFERQTSSDGLSKPQRLSMMASELSRAAHELFSLYSSGWSEKEVASELAHDKRMTHTASARSISSASSITPKSTALADRNNSSALSSHYPVSAAVHPGGSANSSSVVPLQVQEVHETSFEQHEMPSLGGAIGQGAANRSSTSVEALSQEINEMKKLTRLLTRTNREDIEKTLQQYSTEQQKQMSALEERLQMCIQQQQQALQMPLALIACLIFVVCILVVVLLTK